MSQKYRSLQFETIETCDSMNGQCKQLNILKVLQDLFQEANLACISDLKMLMCIYAFTYSLTFQAQAFRIISSVI